jgi:hypothetical protein
MERQCNGHGQEGGHLQLLVGYVEAPLDEEEGEGHVCREVVSQLLHQRLLQLAVQRATTLTHNRFISGKVPES